MNPLIIGALVTAVGSFGAGWYVHGWKTDSEALAQLEKLSNDIRKREQDRDTIDQQYDRIRGDLSALRRAKPPECRFSAEQLRIVNQALGGTLPATAGTGKP